MPGQRNPLTEGKRIVTQRLVGPASYSTGGDTWTFTAVRNVRRVEDVIWDLSASFGAGETGYFPVVIASDGQGNTRTVQVYALDYDTMVWSELTNGTALDGENFIATLELAEGV